MQYRTLGRTGLKASVIGLGAGGPSRLGLRDSLRSEAESIDLVLRALDAGINFIDTAEAYRTEAIIGAAIAKCDRGKIIISTKKQLRGELITRDELRAGLHESLRRLGTDYVDVYHLHGLKPEAYDYYLHEIAPAMLDLQDEGKIRFLGVTEHWSGDLEHEMLARAIQDGVWDVIMVGFNLLNQSARDSVLRPAMKHDIGVLIMFAIRRALSQPAKLKATLQTLVEHGEVDPKDLNLANPLSFLVDSGAAPSIADAAYRFCRDEPGTHVILSGTGNPQHLDANLATFERPPLPPEVSARLKQIFRHARSVTGG